VVRAINYPSGSRKDLKLLVEDFLEKKNNELYQLNRDEATELFWNLNRILQKNTLQEGQPDAQDLAGTDLREVLVEWHQILFPIWRRFRKALFDFKDKVLPDRAAHDSMVKSVDDPSSPMHEYQELMSTAYSPTDKLYDLKVRGTAYNVTLTFDTGKVSFLRKDLNIVNGFLDTLRNAPIDLFSRCKHCNKVIIITREGKSYCKGCAAKARQKELWEKDPEGCREREKKRYDQKRKIKRG
jgi:hypothetical protein